MDQNNTPIVEPLPTPQPPTNQPPTSTEAVSDRSFIASFAMAAVAGWTGLRSFYIKNRTLGYVRLSLFSLAVLLIVLGMALPISDNIGGMIMGVGMFLLIPVGIWALVDMLRAYFGRPVDANRQALYETSPDDRRVAKTLLIGNIIVGVVGSLSLVALITAMILTRPSTGDADIDQVFVGVDRQEALAVYDKITVDSSKNDIEKALQVSRSCEASYCSYSVNPTENAFREISRITVSFDGDKVYSRSLEDNFVDPGPTIFDQMDQQLERLQQDANSTIDNFNSQFNQ